MPPTEQEIKREKSVSSWFVISLHFMAVFILGVSLFPFVGLLWWTWHTMAAFHPALKIFVFSLCIPAGYFAFGTTLIFVCIGAKNLFGFGVKPGLYPALSGHSRSWAGYNSLILIANATFLDVLRLSPFQNLFYRLMGAKIGKDVQVNTGGLADLSLLEIGDDTVIGGGVALICHAFDRGMLRLEGTKLGNRVSIGLNTVIMPGCEIGDGASIGPCSFLPRGTRIPPKGVWGGNPLRDLRAERREARASEAGSQG